MQATHRSVTVSADLEPRRYPRRIVVLTSLPTDFLYQRNLPDHPDEWLKYNDSNGPSLRLHACCSSCTGARTDRARLLVRSVTKITKEEVFGDTGTNSNPYLLVYARKGESLVKTVVRSIVT